MPTDTTVRSEDLLVALVCFVNLTTQPPNRQYTTEFKELAVRRVEDELTMVWFRRKPAGGLMHHSDRGSQYASQPFQHNLREYGMICSMSRKGNCWDNAPTESWFNSFKNERVHGIRYDTRAAMMATSFEYIEAFYNRTRRHSTLDYQSPMQFLEDWRLAQHEGNLVA